MDHTGRNFIYARNDKVNGFVKEGGGFLFHSQNYSFFVPSSSRYDKILPGSHILFNQSKPNIPNHA